MEINIQVAKGTSLLVLNEILSHLDIIKEQIIDQLRSVGESIVTDAVNLAPEKTGFLKKNIHMVITNDGIEIISSAPYSVYQELGTSRGIVPKRYMSISFNTHKQEMRNAIALAIKEFFSGVR